MSHVRTQIRQAAAAALASVAHVETSRAYQLTEEELPVLLVSTNSEEISSEDMNALDRRLTLVVEAVARGDFVDDDLDTLLVGVEHALSDSTLGGLVLHLLPTGIDVAISADGNAPIGRARLTYQALYRTSFSDSETSI